MALVATLMMITVFLILIGVLMENLAREVNVSGMHGRSNAALRAAYYAVESMQYQIEFNDAGAAPGVVPAPFGGSWVDQDGTNVAYNVSVDAQRWTSVLPYYLVHATATDGTSTRSVDALLQKMPFSAYNYFTISEQTNLGGAVVYTNGEQFNGPVYSGGPMIIDYQDAQPSIFTNEVWTASAPHWIPAAPSTPADWSAVISNQGNFHIVSQPLQLPTALDNTSVEYASLTGNPNPSSPPTIPTVQDMYINGASVVGGGGALNTGVFIKGRATITSTVVGNVDTFTIQICCAGLPVTTYHMIVDYGASTTRITDASNNPVANYTGVPSGQQAPGVSGADGAIFSTLGYQFNAGNVFTGQYTFATIDNATTHPAIFFMGSQTYAQPTTDELAFWSNDMLLDDVSNGNIEIDGLLLTGYYGECTATCNDGTFYNPFCPLIGGCAGGTGVLTLKGSLIENVRGKRGTLGSTVSGFSTDSIYDSRLATKPPPFTPTTTEYDVIALCTTDSGTTCGN
ncbi:MAG: hypothetical protein JO219_05795 [Candidatus Eremiobacteraeota bacterium]|nr:hypothetical protein [Candidatus Eremiobacteraeota bacterium]MBV8365131.1 hypothetical protein [Candidatus Eremiobacteraeota bacterium]